MNAGVLEHNINVTPTSPVDKDNFENYSRTLGEIPAEQINPPTHLKSRKGKCLDCISKQAIDS